MNYLLYARKSIDRDDMQALSIESQLVELRALARKESIRITAEFVEARTAKDPGRPVFDRMIQTIQREPVHGILSWHPDRLARNALDGGMILYLLDTGKLSTLKFPTFWFENTPQGKFMLQIAFGQSKYYVDNLSENIKRGLRQKVRRGEFPQKPPTGYENEPHLRTIVLDPVLAPRVRRVFRMAASGRHSLDEVCALARGLRLRNRTRGPVNIRTIRLLLSNPMYDGKFRWGGQVLEGTHPRLVPAHVFKRAQALLAHDHNVRPAGVTRRRRKKRAAPERFRHMLRLADDLQRRILREAAQGISSG